MKNHESPRTPESEPSLENGDAAKDSWTQDGSYEAWLDQPDSSWADEPEGSSWVDKPQSTWSEPDNPDDPLDSGESNGIAEPNQSGTGGSIWRH
jgi:hypothetical protein